MLYFFLCALSREPQTLDELVEKIQQNLMTLIKKQLKKTQKKFMKL